jgi:hypothetical protein
MPVTSQGQESARLQTLAVLTSSFTWFCFNDYWGARALIFLRLVKS